MYWRDERFEEVAGALARVLAVEREVDPAEHPRIARTLNHLGLLRPAAQRYEKAEMLLRQSLELERRVHGAGGAERGAVGSLLPSRPPPSWKRLTGALSCRRRRR